MPTRKPKRLQPPRLAGVYEVAEYLGISRSALAARRVRYQFPRPLTELMCGPIWDLDDIDPTTRNVARIRTWLTAGITSLAVGSGTGIGKKRGETATRGQAVLVLR